ncbi:hypothetical protein M405DRAFT_116135 [Rhizopogon salebrosus TDB-379]|nr:hypothetical protein M405DRAFT_116135 [Rhizopogon salebrosus TDB-379]
MKCNPFIAPPVYNNFCIGCASFQPQHSCVELYFPGDGFLLSLRFIPYFILSATVDKFLLLALLSQECRLSPMAPPFYFSSPVANRVVVLPLILTVPIITSNSYRYAQCNALISNIRSASKDAIVREPRT